MASSQDAVEEITINRLAGRHSLDDRTQSRGDPKKMQRRMAWGIDLVKVELICLSLIVPIALLSDVILSLAANVQCKW